MDDQVPIPARIRELVAERGDEVVYTVVDPEGGDTSFTWAELDRRSGQVVGALAERGLGFGDGVGRRQVDPARVPQPPPSRRAWSRRSETPSSLAQRSR